MEQKSMDYCMEQLKKLCAIHSPSGMTDEVAAYLMEEFSRLGYARKRHARAGLWYAWAEKKPERKTAFL